MAKTAERAGKPDVGELVRQGRLKYNATRGLDPNPNPEVGQVANPDSGMRAGLTPEKYHRLVLLSERRRRMGKESDFVPELEDHEWDIYLAWLKSGGPTKMRAVGKEIGRSQAFEAANLLKKYDPQNAAKLAAIPEHPRAQVRDAIGGIPSDSAVEADVEDIASEINLPKAPKAKKVEEPEDEPDLAPEAKVKESPPEAPGYEGVDADEADTPPVVVSPKRGKNKNK